MPPPHTPKGHHTNCTTAHTTVGGIEVLLLTLIVNCQLSIINCFSPTAQRPTPRVGECDVATGYSVIVQGDLNHTPDGSEYELWVEARPLYEGDFRLYADRSDFVALSDHLPQMAKFE